MEFNFAQKYIVSIQMVRYLYFSIGSLILSVIFGSFCWMRNDPKLPLGFAFTILVGTVVFFISILTCSIASLIQRDYRTAGLLLLTGGILPLIVSVSLVLKGSEFIPEGILSLLISPPGLVAILYATLGVILLFIRRS